MKSKLVILFLFISTLVYSQTSTVTATITDAAAQPFANGTYKIEFYPTPGTPGPFTQNGSSFTKLFTGSLSGVGAFSVVLTRNDFIQPANSQWSFTVCPNASVSSCTTYVGAIGAGPVSLSSQISTLTGTINFPTLPNANYGYLNSEVVPIPNPGGMYWDVINLCLKIWTGSVWSCLTTTTASNFVLLGPLGAQTVTQPANTDFIINTSGSGATRLNNVIVTNGENVSTGNLAVSAGNITASGNLNLGGTGALSTTAQSGSGSICMTSGCTQNNPILNGTPTGTAIPTFTLKKGSGSGSDYTTTSTSYVDVDSTNLGYTVTIPTGWKLAISARAGVNPGAGDSGVSLFDGATLIESLQAASGGFESAVVLWVINGDGASHTVKLQFKSVTAGTTTIKNQTATNTADMIFILSPSN